MISIDLNRLTYAEFRELMQTSDNEGDTIALLTRVVTAWEFEGDPADPASYESLGLLDLLAIQKALRGAIAEALGESDAGN